MSNSTKHSFHTAKVCFATNADLSIYSEVYVGLGSRTAVPIPPVTIYLLPHFRSSVTDTIEMCVAIFNIFIRRHVLIGGMAQGCRPKANRT